MSIMMVLDYLNEALKKKGESSDNNGSFLYYEDVLKKLSTEVKSWTFISKGMNSRIAIRLFSFSATCGI